MENSAKPDLKTGFPLDNLPDGGMILGQADGEDVVLARRGDELFRGRCVLYPLPCPLADGLIVGAGLAAQKPESERLCGTLGKAG